MQLQPKQPPGRRSRRARAYGSEIVRLHDQGYSLDGIREALAEAGVQVSRSTVRRELMRPPVPQTAPPAWAPPDACSASPPTWTEPAGTRERPWQATARENANAPPPLLSRPTTQSAKDFAAEFMKGCITNPFLRNRS